MSPLADYTRTNGVGRMVRYHTRDIMRALVWTIIVTTSLCLWIAEVSAEIYSCEGEDGVATYQDQPCPDPAPATADLEPEPVAEPADTPRAPEAPRTATPDDTELVAACKKRYRDEIDRLDAELASGAAADQLEDYRERARALSQQLSRCEHGGANPTGGDGRPEPAGRDL